MMNIHYDTGSIVWVRIGQKWWPARVISLEECPSQYTLDLKEEPLAVVRFFNETGIHEVTKPEQIFSYGCGRKEDLIRKGLNSIKYDSTLSEKFEADIVMAEKLTGGNMDIVKELKEQKEREASKRIDYSNLGFGEPKPKKYIRDQSMQKDGFTNIGEAIQYKTKLVPLASQIIEHKTKILEQPKQIDSEVEMRNASNLFKCYVCGFTCTRLNVIIWHNKAHLKKVEDYDSGIRIPKRRKVKRKSKSKSMSKSARLNLHSETNGHVSPRMNNSREANQLLLDWEDDEQIEFDVDVKNKVGGLDEEELTENGVEDDDDELSCDDENYSSDEYDDNYLPPSKGRRQPMPKQVDINSAFDALLAESSPLNRSRGTTLYNYLNNDSDSDSSDWEKYYVKESGSLSSTVGNVKDEKKNWDDRESENGIGKKPKKYGQKGNSSDDNSISNGEPFKKERKSYNSSMKRKGLNKCQAELANHRISSASPSQSASKNTSPLAQRVEVAEDHCSSSSSSSSSSGPAYMLVAVDAHGNNVPMPVLSEGGNHLVAVEASMEDGTTRTLYIDPAHLGPNVDLNNLMLHIDNSGQETVIIPTSTSDGEIISSTLVEQAAHENISGNSSQSRSPYCAVTATTAQQVPVTVSPVKNRHTQESRERKERQDCGAKVRIQDADYHFACSSAALQSAVKKSVPKEKDCFTSSETIENAFKSSEHKFPLIEKGFDLKKCSMGTSGDELKNDYPEEMENKRKREVEEKENKGSEKNSCNEEEETEELPDLQVAASNRPLFSKDEIVWVLTHGLWWPSFVLKVYSKENKASILFINCQQKTPIKVGLNRMNHFSYMGYTELFNSQKSKAVGLTEAMEMAFSYCSLKDENALKQSPKEFFSLPISEQRSVINHQQLALRGISIDEPPKRLSIENDAEGEQNPTFVGTLEKSFSSREGDKDIFSSVSEEQQNFNEAIVKFIKSDVCINHLHLVSTGKFSSARHQYFHCNFQQSNFLMTMAGVYNNGSEFFTMNNTEQTEEILLYLCSHFEKNGEFEPNVGLPYRNLYVNTVLLPEAIKESMRVLTKLKEEDLEEALNKGISKANLEVKTPDFGMDVI